MAMREKYTKPGEKIHYYLVEWDPAKLSWEDFRGKVLGATDPATAADGSLRKTIFAQWKSLGLKSEPNVGDNGVHASASPLEGLFERMNWWGSVGSRTTGRTQHCRSQRTLLSSLSVLVRRREREVS